MISFELLERMNIPKNYWECTRDNIPHCCSHREKFIDYVNNIDSRLKVGKGLVLYGNHSTGKSGCASIILKAAADKKQIGLWTTGSQIVTAKIEKIPFDEEQTLWQRAIYVPVLVIDEIIFHANNPVTHLIWEELVRNRLANKYITIVTTNHVPEAFYKTNLALYTALYEACDFLHVVGHDFRKKT